jgi:Rieske Fe-S protein
VPAAEHGPFIADVVLSRRCALSLGAVTAGAALAACASDGQTEVDPNAAGLTGITLVELETVPIGGAVRVDHPDGAPMIVARPSADEAAAYSAVCTHQSCTVVPAGDRLNCPCHGSVFDAYTGAVINGPARRPLSRVEVHVAHGRVVTGAA